IMLAFVLKPYDNLSKGTTLELEEVMRELESKASSSTKATYLRHGAVEPLFGVKVGDLKPILKKVKGQQDLAIKLFATKNSDAMYLAGLIADGSKMTKKQLDQWAAAATWHMIAGCSVAWVATENPAGFELACKWIDSKKELVAVAGWSTLSGVVATLPDSELPIDDVKQLLDRCVKTIKTSPNRVRQSMNSFIISVGTYVAPLADQAIKSARKIGVVEVDVGDTQCKIPEAESYIIKSRRGANVAPKRKTMRC
ncbi:MAG: DNA alkylation repair protein, partial [Pirellula sp.]